MIVTHFLIECVNPMEFNNFINKSGGTLIEDEHSNQYLKKEGYYVMRVIGDPASVKFSITKHGYGRIIRKFYK